MKFARSLIEPKRNDCPERTCSTLPTRDPGDPASIVVRCTTKAASADRGDRRSLAGGSFVMRAR